MRDTLRRVRLEALRERAFILEVWATDRTDRRGQTVLGYELTDPEGETVFEGEDFAGSPLHADDSDETLRALLGFLTLRPGDTDSDYFEDYTERQKRFCDEDAESLALYADEECGEPLEDVRELVAAYIGDGYLLGVTETEHGNGRRYWDPAGDEESICRAALEDVPESVARRLLDYSAGNSGPDPLSDGYEAASLAAPFAGDVISCEFVGLGIPCPTCGYEVPSEVREPGAVGG